MAKRKSNIGNKAKGNDGKPRVKPERKSLWGGLFHFIISPLVWRLIWVIIIVAVLFWLWGRLDSWVTDVTESIVELFGWGLVLIAIAVIIIMGVIWRRHLSAWARRWKLYQWHKWLGAIAFILAVWGILALFDLGGSFGQRIINYGQGLMGILRILGLVILGVILVAPRACFRLVANFISWLGKKLKRQPTPKIAPLPTLAPTSVVEAPQPSKPESEPEKETVTQVFAPTQAQQELRQVAQEVWTKYGESAALMTVDCWQLPPRHILENAAEAEMSQAYNLQRVQPSEDA